MAVLPYLVLYGGIVVFVIAVALRLRRFMRLPLHLRWELYPVPHEGAGRARYGGSYFEQVAWWSKPMQKSQLGAIKAMAEEILFLVALYRHNRRLWWCSFPFHFGLYLLCASGAMLVVDAITNLIDQPFAEMLWTNVFGLLTGVAFTVGLLLSLSGAGALLYRRLANPKLRPYTNVADVLHLILFVVFFIVLGLTLLFADPGFAEVRQFIRSSLTFACNYEMQSAWLEFTIVFTAILIAYIPTTRMAHFVLKWFTYHNVRWDDALIQPGSAAETRIKTYLEQPVSWSAPHLSNARTWKEAATREVPNG